MRSLISYLKPLVVYQFAVLLLIYLYLKMSHNWAPISGTGSELWKIEIPFFLLLSGALYFPNINNKVIKYVFPVLPVWVAYSLFDVFYDYYGRSPRPSDFHNFYSIFEFSPELAAGFILYALIAPFAVFILLYQSYRGRSSKSLFIDILARASLISFLIMFLLSDAVAEYTKSTFEEVEWSHQLTIKANGRLSSFVYYGNQEKENLKALYEHKPGEVDIYESLYPGDPPRRKNIHIVVLESFIDPRLLKDVVFDMSPLATELKVYLPDGGDEFSHVIAPVYGGGTPQSEFELLTGIKALSKITSMEFNIMAGGVSSSLVNRLAELEYSPIVTIASSSGFYNSKQAYKSLGFPDVTYLEESDYETRAGDRYIFDGDVFEFSLDKIKQHMESDDAPVISYVLGMYGHIPFDRNTSIRPDVVDARHLDERIRFVSNQFYYRTKAIAYYIERLLAIDPDSIIYVTSDHLPPLLGDDIEYAVDSKVNIALLLDGGKPIDVTGKHFYEIPWFLWDLLRNCENRRVINDIEMEKLYFQFLHESVTNT